MTRMTVSFIIISALFWASTLTGGDTMQTPVKLNTSGLKLWLDASDESTIVRDSRDSVSRWKDKSGNDRHATVSGEITLVERGMNDRNTLRFSGAGYFHVPAIRESAGQVTVFVVSQRLDAQASDKRWQRLISCWDGKTKDDIHEPSFCITGDRKGRADPYDAAIYQLAGEKLDLSTLRIGASSRSEHQFFRGDIAEILVYDHVFLTSTQTDDVLDYLAGKWGAERPIQTGWTRVGPPGETPERTTDDYPLSDQGNRENWVKYKPMSDEFDGNELDTEKWTLNMTWWKGRQPALFREKNVTVRDGMLHLTMRKEELPEEFRKHGYHDYSSAALHTKDRTCYGYFEVKARPMDSAGSSSFWFQQDTIPGWSTEIDVFEIGGKARGYEHKVNMNLHVFRTPAEKKHWSTGGQWTAPWRLADDYHVYGLEWDENEIKYYVDGIVVRTARNTHWHQPLYLIFDSETMPDWLGMPEDEDLPSTYSIEYVRAWKKASPER